MTAFENLKGKTKDYVILFSEMMVAVSAVKSTPRLLIVVQINHVSIHKVYSVHYDTFGGHTTAMDKKVNCQIWTVG